MDANGVTCYEWADQLLRTVGLSGSTDNGAILPLGIEVGKKTSFQAKITTAHDYWWHHAQWGLALDEGTQEWTIPVYGTYSYFDDLSVTSRTDVLTLYGLGLSLVTATVGDRIEHFVQRNCAPDQPPWGHDPVAWRSSGEFFRKTDAQTQEKTFLKNVLVNPWQPSEVSYTDGGADRLVASDPIFPTGAANVFAELAATVNLFNEPDFVDLSFAKDVAAAQAEHAAATQAAIAAAEAIPPASNMAAGKKKGLLSRAYDFLFGGVQDTATVFYNFWYDNYGQEIDIRRKQLDLQVRLNSVDGVHNDAARAAINKQVQKPLGEALSHLVQTLATEAASQYGSAFSNATTSASINRLAALDAIASRGSLRMPGPSRSVSSSMGAHTGRLGGELYGEENLDALAKNLRERGVLLRRNADALLDRKKANGLFYASEGGMSEMWLRANPTRYEVQHELFHLEDLERLGFRRYNALGKAGRELSVYNHFKGLGFAGLTLDEIGDSYWQVLRALKDRLDRLGG